MKLRVSCAAGVMILLTLHGFAIFMGDPLVPVDRLITNTTAYIKEHPEDPMGPYTLARIHYLALATGSSRVLGFDRGARNPLPTVNEPIPPGGRPGRAGSPAPTKENAWTEAQLREHLQQAIENYQKALKMDDKNALFHLGLASVSQAALNAGFKLGPIPGLQGTEPPKDGDFAPVWREQAIAEYLKAYQLSAGTEATISYGHIASGEMSVLLSSEAGQKYVELVTARGVRDTERATVDKIRTALTQPRGSSFGITPIVFRLNGAAPLDRLLDPQKVVSFDLDGTRRPQRYTWVRPDTGILVWDPSNEGRIVSGHQLFGSVSFHMFWSDGYRALDALDDNRDGELRGAELTGLAVWFDRNQNGVSDAGEVVAIERTGIAALSVRATQCVGESLSNEAGLTMIDGRVLPTYDWTTKALMENAAKGKT
jgi:hypothetical protein